MMSMSMGTEQTGEETHRTTGARIVVMKTNFSGEKMTPIDIETLPSNLRRIGREINDLYQQKIEGIGIDDWKFSAEPDSIAVLRITIYGSKFIFTYSEKYPQESPKVICEDVSLDDVFLNYLERNSSPAQTIVHLCLNIQTYLTGTFEY